MKTCNTCLIEKPLDAFSISRAEKDGRQYKCKECARVYRNENREAYNEWMRQDRLADDKGVYLGVAKTIRGDFYPKVGESGQVRHRAARLAGAARDVHQVDAEYAEVFWLIEEADPERRLELEAKLKKVAEPLFGDEFYHVSAYTALLDAFIREGAQRYTKRKTYQARHDEFIEYLAKRDAAAWEKPPKKKRSLPNPFERRRR